MIGPKDRKAGRTDAFRHRGWFIFGDSHIVNFHYAHRQKLIDRPCRFKKVGGATAVGLRNPNSITDALGQFKGVLIPAQPDIIPVIHIGEVDCGYLIWWRAQKYDEPIAKQFEESINAYFAFVDQLLAAGYPSVVVTGASLPTIRDGQYLGDIASARREVTATLKQRTDLTLRYNNRLKKEADIRMLPFVDVSGDMIDPHTGTVADKFRSTDAKDHHLNPAHAGPCWGEALNGIRFPALRRYRIVRRLVRCYRRYVA